MCKSSLSKSIKIALLINPPTGLYDRYERCQSPVEFESVKMVRPPLDLMYLASILERNGIKVIIRDYPAEGNNCAIFIKDIKRICPDLILASSTLSTYSKDCYFLKIAKEIDNSIVTVLKGVFPGKGEQILLQHPDVDLIIREESESTLEEFIQNKSLDEIKGLTYRDNNTVRSNESRDRLLDLDSLPSPARHLTNNDLYRMPDNGKRMGLVLASKGCPFECIFCLAPIVDGKKVRLRSPLSLVNEIKECIGKYKISDFWFRADSFTINKKWVIEICKQIIDEKLKIRWATNSRVDNVDEEMLAILKQAGCFALGFGIESGNEETLRKIKKNITKQQVKYAVNLCKRFGIQTYLFFIIGFPWEDKSHIKDTIEFAKELNGDVFNFSLATPFPGTELLNEAKALGLLNDKIDQANFNYVNPSIDTLYIKKDRLLDIEKTAYRQIALRPSYIVKHFRNIKSPLLLINYIKAAFHLFKILF